MMEQVCINHVRWVLEDGCPSRDNIHVDSPCEIVEGLWVADDLRKFHDGRMTMQEAKTVFDAYR